MADPIIKTDLSKVMANVKQAVTPELAATSIMVVTVVPSELFEQLAAEFPNALDADREITVAQGSVMLTIREA